MGGLVGAMDSVRARWASIRPRKESGAERSPTEAGNPASLFCPDQLVGGEGAKRIKKNTGWEAHLPFISPALLPTWPKRLSISMERMSMDLFRLLL